MHFYTCNTESCKWTNNLHFQMFRLSKLIDFLSWNSAETCWAKFSWCQTYSPAGWDPFGSCIKISSGFQAVTVSRKAQNYIRKINISWNMNIFWLEIKTCVKLFYFFKWWTGNVPLKKERFAQFFWYRLDIYVMTKLDKLIEKELKQRGGY